MSKDLKFLKTIGTHDYFEYKPTLFHPFYINLEELTIRKRIRFILAYFNGYRVYYMYENNNIVGYCMISKGGNYRYNFTTKEDIIVGPYYIAPDQRGKGKSITLIKDVLNNLELQFVNAYDYIKKTNIPSIKATERSGFTFVSNAKITKILRAVRLTSEKNANFVVYRCRRNLNREEGYTYHGK